MATTQRQTITLTEYTPHPFPADLLSQAEGEQLWRRYGKYVGVEFPSPKTAHQWQLTARGWVGYLPISSRMGFSLQPKVPLHNLFRMVEVAYGLEALDFSKDLFHCATLIDFYEHLALVLARRIQVRCRTGLYQAYAPYHSDLPYVRGTFQLERALQRPWQRGAPCRYEEQTTDVEENRILAWTLWQILRSGLCSESTFPVVRDVYRMLLGAVSLQPVSDVECANRYYNRLNEDYRPLHALCRFFLEQSGPSHAVGDREMLAFLLDMAHLYERFVAAWLLSHLTAQMQVRVQERVRYGMERGQYFAIDVVLYSRRTGQPWAVLDTKYKAPATTPTADDLAQVVTYATAKGCKEALLVYPVELRRPFEERIGDVRVRSIPFQLDSDLDMAGQRVLDLLKMRHVE